MTTGAVIVVGSINVDVAVGVEALPRPGQTVLGRRGGLSLGGKGFNQALASHRAGGQSRLLARVGADHFADAVLAMVRESGLQTTSILRDQEMSTGCAGVLVADSGENMIAVAPGSNMALSPKQIDAAAEDIRAADVLVTQLEIPLDTAAKALSVARSYRVQTVLNASPTHSEASHLLPLSDIVIVNEDELAALSKHVISDQSTIAVAARSLALRGAQTVVVTLGRAGCAVWTEGKFYRLPGHEMNAVDTTGAGDVFAGTLALAIAEGRSLLDSIRFAQAAAALSVERFSADSAPARDVIDRFLAERATADTNRSHA